MQLEGVGSIAVGNLAFQVGGKVDDGNGIKRTFLGADTTTNAQRLGYKGKSRCRRDLNAELATAYDRAGLLALLATLARTTLYTDSNVSSCSLFCLSVFAMRGGVGGVFFFFAPRVNVGKGRFRN
jgi:hypothetical protein